MGHAFSGLILNFIMDLELQQCLTSLGLEELIDVFKENYVCYSTLKLLSEDDFKCLIPKVGQRALLRNHLHSQSFSALETVPKSTASTIILEHGIDIEENDSETITIQEVNEENISYTEISSCDKEHTNGNSRTGTSITPKFEVAVHDSSVEDCPPRKKIRTDYFLSCKHLKDFLADDIRGQTVLESYSKNKKLDSQDRRCLVEIIITALLSRHSSVKYEMLQSLSQEIVNLFPSESVDAYFCYNKLVSKNPRGKLLDKYRNMKSFLDKNKPRQREMSTPSTSKPKLDASVLDAIKWLQHSREPWSKVVQNWLTTYSARRADCQSDMCLSSLLKKWPLFKHSHGHSLVSISSYNIHIKYSYSEIKAAFSYPIFIISFKTL